MKPIIRWTIGNVYPNGLYSLKVSIKLFSELYPNFDLYVCYNNIDNPCLKELKTLGVKLINQEKHIDSLAYKPKLATWKLFPPRLNINTHEIVVDNDLIIKKECPFIEEFINGKHTLLCEGKHRLFGRFEKYVPKNYKINCGLYGMPPKFDFQKEISNILAQDKKEFTNFFDDQGLVAACLTKIKHEVISRKDISITEAKEKLIDGEYGIHFVQLNREKIHKGWNQYCDKF